MSYRFLAIKPVNNSSLFIVQPFWQNNMVKIILFIFLHQYFASFTQLPTSWIPSQRVMKEIPRKRPKVPPNSATWGAGFRKECNTGKILPGQIHILWTILVRNNASVKKERKKKYYHGHLSILWTIVHIMDKCPQYGLAYMEKSFVVMISVPKSELC